MLDHLKYYFAQKEARVIGFVFLFNSFLFGNWVTRIPDVKQQLGLNDADLGLALLAAPFGAMLIMPISGWIIARFSLGRVVFVSSLFHLAAPILLSTAPSFYFLAAALFYFGLTNALMDIAMNAAAAATEKKMAKPIMSTCHGMWSLGAMIGSGLGSIYVGLKIDVAIHLAPLSVLVLIIVALLAKPINGYSEEISSDDKVFAWPNLSLLGLAFIGFCILLSEGAIADWSAVYMSETLQSNAFMTGLAFSGFSALMALGRFSGDNLIPKFGARYIALFGAVISFLGLGLTLIIADPYFSVLGFSITGLGYSCLVPVLFSSAAREPGYTAGTGIAAVTTLGYTGFLVGPPAIGFISEAFSLTAGLALVVILSGACAILSLFVRWN